MYIAKTATVHTNIISTYARYHFVSCRKYGKSIFVKTKTKTRKVVLTTELSSFSVIKFDKHVVWYVTDSSKHRRKQQGCNKAFTILR